MTLIWIWAAVFAVSLVLEFITMEMVSIWISLGAIVGIILAALGVGLEWQIITVCVISILAIIFLRKFALKFLHKSGDKQSAEVLIGKICLVEEDISPEKAGTVKLNGVLWTALSDEVLSKGQTVKVSQVIGNKLKVKGE